MKLFKFTTLTLMTVLSLTACNKASEQANDNNNDKKATSTETAKENPNLLLDMTMETLKMPMDVIKSSEQITAEEKACVEKIDLNSQKNVIKEAIENAFSKEEIGQLNEFYAQPEVQKVTNYGREQLLLQMGVPLEETAEKPSEKEIKVVAEFAKTEIGQKYAQFNLSEDANSTNTKVNTFIEEELDKCGLGEEKQQ